MPRPKKEGVEPKTRSRTGCWPCKARKIKCGEEKPVCTNCARSGEDCDYSIRLNWSGRGRSSISDGSDQAGGQMFSFVADAAASGGNVFSSQQLGTSLDRREDATAPMENKTKRGTSSTVGARFATFNHYQPKGMPRASSPSTELSTHSAPPVPSFDGSTNGAKRPRLDSSHRLSSSGITKPSKSPSSSIRSPGSTASSLSGRATTILEASYPAVRSYAPHNAGPSRGLSVKSLLTEPAGENNFLLDDLYEERTYGYDYGRPDLDVPRNDDAAAMHPNASRNGHSAAHEEELPSGYETPRQTAFEPGGYYQKRVPVKIPRYLEPLPDQLLRNPMQLLYFHHFINHTGRILVPHDCPENPFRGVLAQMSLRNERLLQILLVVSASHRARLLNHPEPANRIAEWMNDVLPSLRKALVEPRSNHSDKQQDPQDPSSLAPLATALMLTSLDILTPDTFVVSIPWYRHVEVARKMVISKGGLDHLAQRADGPRDKAVFLLSRWFAYYDVIGSLAGCNRERPLYGAYLEHGGGLWLVNRDNDEISKIDCFFGFSGRCISLLAQVSDLVHQCHKLRIDQVTGQIKSSYQPSESTRNSAEDIKRRLAASATTEYKGCTHNHSGPGPATPDFTETEDIQTIIATNEAYHWAGQLHLSRRVLALQSSDPIVQAEKGRVIACLNRVTQGSSAWGCLLFPIFYAGAEALDEDERNFFRERMRGAEGWGMGHFQRGRALLERVWATGKSWETLIDGEFFG